MMIHTKRIAGLFAALFVGLLAGCHNAAPSKPVVAVAPPAATAPSPSVPSAPDEKSTPAHLPIKDRVDAFLADQAHAAHPLLPTGVRLLHSELSEGVVTLDFSSEFNSLANMGDSVEGAAQKALCAALAPVEGVEKLKVTVEGKPFDSQMADWSTPFPVRGATASAEGGGSRE